MNSSPASFMHACIHNPKSFVYCFDSLLLRLPIGAFMNFVVDIMHSVIMLCIGVGQLKKWLSNMTTFTIRAVDIQGQRATHAVV